MSSSYRMSPKSIEWFRMSCTLKILPCKNPYDNHKPMNVEIVEILLHIISLSFVLKGF